MLKYFKSFWVVLFGNIFVFSAIFFIALGFIFYSISGRGVRQGLVEQMLHREQVIARSGANSIEGFFNLLDRSLKVFVSTADNINQETLDSFISDWESTPVTGVIVSDNKGFVRYNANNRGVPGEIGISVADRDYFIWAKKAGRGEIFVGEPVVSRLGTTKGQFVATLSTPLFENDEFSGVLTAAILMSELTRDYLDPLKISDKTRIYLMDPTGTVIVSPFINLVGVNYSEFLGHREIARVLKERVKSSDEGKLNVALLNEETGLLTPFLIAHSPIQCDTCGEHWTLVVATPADDALSFFGPIFTKQVAVMIIIFLAIVVYTVRVAKISGFKEGFSLHDKLYKEDPQKKA